MANKLLEGLGNTKVRALALLLGAGVLIVSVVIYTSARKPNPLKTEESRSSKIPQISAIPGQITSEKYQELQEEDNRRRAELAKKTGGSAVATIIGTLDKNSSMKRESFGIEGEFKGAECKCPQTTSDDTVPDLDPALAAKLISQIEANPESALKLMQENPGLAKALCNQKPDLALKTIENNKAAAKIMLNECPAMAKLLAEKNPALFKQLMLENPELVKKLANANPALLKKMLQDDPEFAKKMATQNPGVLKTLMKNDADFTSKMAAQHPEMVKDLMKTDPEFSNAIAKNNPALLKKMMLDDPEFAKTMAKNNPETIKTLMKNDPDFTEKMAAQNTELLKELMKTDPEFSNAIAKNNPALLKKMMLDDPEFAKTMAKNNPETIKTLMKNDPDFTEKMAAQNPEMLKELMKTDPEFSNAIAKNNPALLKKMMLDDPEFAKTMAKNNPMMVNALMEADPNFSKALREKNPGLTAILESSLKNAPFLNDKQRVQSLQDTRRKQREDQDKRTREIQLNELQQKQLAALLTNMDAQSKAVFQAWNDIAPQQFAQGEYANKKTDKNSDAPEEADSSTNNGSQTNPKNDKNVLIKAGSIIFAVLDTAVNTDEPGPVMATITTGPFTGSKVLGDIQIASATGGNRPEKVILNFSTLSTPDDSKSISIKGVAIDPDTARTAVASAVDHHYLLRYGTLFASSFMTGYAKAITSQGTTQVSTGTGTTSTVTQQLNGRQQLFAALGQVGQNLGSASGNYFNTPNTITVNSGTGFGLLILSDVTN